MDLSSIILEWELLLRMLKPYSNQLHERSVSITDAFFIVGRLAQKGKCVYHEFSIPFSEVSGEDSQKAMDSSSESSTNKPGPVISFLGQKSKDRSMF